MWGTPHCFAEVVSFCCALSLQSYGGVRLPHVHWRCSKDWKDVCLLPGEIWFHYFVTESEKGASSRDLRPKNGDFSRSISGSQRNFTWSKALLALVISLNGGALILVGWKPQRQATLCMGMEEAEWHVSGFAGANYKGTGLEKSYNRSIKGAGRLTEKKLHRGRWKEMWEVTQNNPNLILLR